MIWSKKNKEQERFYLLPGQGGKAFRRKRLIFLAWAIVAGLAVSTVLAIALYLANRR